MRSELRDSGQPALGKSDVKILIVDDQPDLAESLAMLLDAQGHECVAATSAQEAKRLCETTAFDVLLTDYSMPGMSGLDLAIEMRRLHPQAAIVIFTAYGSTFYQREEREPEVDAVLQKPVTASELQAVLRRVTSRSKHHRDGSPSQACHPAKAPE